jgi:hypothetical protein
MAACAAAGTTPHFGRPVALGTYCIQVARERRSKTFTIAVRCGDRIGQVAELP